VRAPPPRAPRAPRAALVRAALVRAALVRAALVRAALCVVCAAPLSACGARVRPLEGAWHTVQEGDTLSAIAAARGVPLSDLIELNALLDPATITVGQRLFVPSARAAQRGAGAGAAPAGARGMGRAPGSPPLPLERVMALAWPLSPALVDLSSPFGARGEREHHGLDLRAPEGTPTLSLLDGVVTRAAFDEGGYGWYVVVDHGDGLESRYAHHRKNLAQEGQRVARGERLGLVGSTGRSSGPHLHLELRYRGAPLDPLIYLPALPAP